MIVFTKVSQTARYYPDRMDWNEFDKPIEKFINLEHVVSVTQSVNYVVIKFTTGETIGVADMPHLYI
jgi:hypothetical protein